MNTDKEDTLDNQTWEQQGRDALAEKKSEPAWVVSDTYSDEGPQCPHCGRQYTADEPHFYDERNYTEDTCDTCEKPFQVSVYTSTTWSCEPVEASDQ